MLSAAFIFSFSNNYSVGYFSCGERKIINQAGGEGGKKWGKSINRASKNQSRILLYVIKIKDDIWKSIIHCILLHA